MFKPLDRIKNSVTSTVNVLGLILFLSLPTIEAAQYARKAAAAAGSAAYWTLTAGMPIFMVKALVDKKSYEAFYEQSKLDEIEALVPEATAFIKEQLQSAGFPNARFIPLHMPVDHIASAAIKDIVINPHCLDNMQASIERIAAARERQEQPSEEDLSLLRQIKGLIKHEANHILHNDITCRFPAVAICSALMPVGLRVAWRAGRPIVAQAKKMPNVRKFLQGLINLGVSFQLYCAGSRIIEQQADDAVTDPEAIKGLSELFKDFNRVLDENAKNPVLLWINNNALTHPSPALRAERLEERLQEKLRS